MITVRMTEAELARDVHAVLEKVRQGMEVVIEQDSCPVAVLKAPRVNGRKITAVIAAHESNGASAAVKGNGSSKVEEGAKSHRDAWNLASWD
jgi:antitoxin (DNA-binding transcriptional repressor) of toxin-antitoxin stability system